MIGMIMIMIIINMDNNNYDSNMIISNNYQEE